MATNENLIPIPGRLHSVASDEIVSGANEIYDDKLSDNQENLNTGFTNDIDTIYNTIGDNNEKGAIMEQLNTIDGRLDTIDGEISALNHIPIEVVPLNSAGTAPNVNNPKENTLYRAYNSDKTLYSDWMYKDGQWIMIFEQESPSEQEKLVGYYVCDTEANVAGKQITTGNSGYVLPANGGAMKIKMTNVNTADNATLKIGSETAKPLWYNDERASSSNTWEEGEVISVYYDGENYKASNAMGGGSAVGKKKLTPLQGYIDNYETTLGAVHTASADKTNYRYIKYPAKEGDVVQISGTGASAARLWGIVGEENVMLDAAAMNLSASDLVLVMPEGTAFITINSKTTSNPEWYYAKAGSVGAHEMLTEAYFYGDLRTLALGQPYALNEAVKTVDKQFFRMNKEIAFMNLTDTITEGDLKVYNNKTYQAQENIVAYVAGVEYEDGAYAIGSPAKLSLAIARETGTYEDGTLDVSIGTETKTITVLSGDSPADIAGNIVSAWSNDTESGWIVSVDNSDIENIKVIAISKRAETHVAGDIKIAANELGVTGTGTAISGGNTTEVRKYNATDNVWSSTNLDDYSADTSIWVQVTDISELLEYTVQDTVDNLSFGSGKTKSVVTTKSYYDNGGQQNYYYDTSSLNVGDLFTGKRNGNSARYCYKVQVFAEDIITFKLSGYAHQCLTGVDCIVTKKVHSDNISNGTVWNVSQDGYFFYNGTDQTGNPVAFTITRSTSNISYSIEHLTPEDSLDSTDATKPLSANQGRILAERTQVVKELMPVNASWDTNKTTSCRITDLGSHCIEFYQSKSTAANYLTLDLSGLENEKTYTLRMNYSSTMGSTSALRRFSNRSTIADSYGGGNLVISDHRDYEFTFKYYSNTPLIGWPCSAFGDASTNNPWTFTIHSISISETYTLEDIYEMASKAGSVENPDEETLRQLKYRTQTSSNDVITTYKNVTLLHFSDIHGDSSAANLIKSYYDKYSDYIDDIIDTGDDVVSIGNEDISFINNSGLGVALRTLGNHDAWYSAMNTWGNRNTLYNKFFKPFIANWGTIVQPDDAETNGLMYWYKDYDVAPVRIIGLDTNFYDGTMIGNPSQYTLDQITWLQGVLADAQNNGKTVVMLSHYIPAEENADTSHVQYNGAITTFSSMRKLSANNGSQLFYGGFMDAVKPYKDIVACWICGHKHDDILFHPASCDDMLVSVINKAGRKSTSTDIVADRSGNGQICANVIAIDPTNKLVKFFRVGLRKDKWMRPINILTYNYNTKEVITNY